MYACGKDNTDTFEQEVQDRSCMITTLICRKCTEVRNITSKESCIFVTKVKGEGHWMRKGKMENKGNIMENSKMTGKPLNFMTAVHACQRTLVESSLVRNTSEMIFPLPSLSPPLSSGFTKWNTCWVSLERKSGFAPPLAVLWLATIVPMVSTRDECTTTHSDVER